ncbi:unnamed protein product [Meloidogyne enterolobii]|uniref:Uncharacterized protein n=1 Tax=Meloidogyne enterolobii TaxID=390850 RepID=A0ACB1AV43_MELEN
MCLRRNKNFVQSDESIAVARRGMGSESFVEGSHNLDDKRNLEIRRIDYKNALIVIRLECSLECNLHSVDDGRNID